MEDLATFYKAEFQSPATPEKSRIEVFRKIGIVPDGTTGITPDALAVNKKFYEALEGIRVDGPYNDTFLSMASTGNIAD